MKQKRILLGAALFMLAQAAFAQVVSDDSIRSLNNNTKMLETALTINNQKIELAKMQNKLFEDNYNVEKQQRHHRNRQAKTKMMRLS